MAIGHEFERVSISGLAIELVRAVGSDDNLKNITGHCAEPSRIVGHYSKPVSAISSTLIH